MHANFAEHAPEKCIESVDQPTNNTQDKDLLQNIFPNHSKVFFQISLNIKAKSTLRMIQQQFPLHREFSQSAVQSSCKD